MNHSEHLSKRYDQELEGLRSCMLEMGGLVEAQILAAIEAFASGEQERIEQVLANEPKVDELEVKIDNDCGQIIARRQPAASDLRLIVAVSRAVTDLERIGDEAEKIARMARQIHERGRFSLEQFAAVRHVAAAAVAMLRGGLDAFARLDAAQAVRVIRDDRAIDSEFRSILRQLITFMMEDPRTISNALDTVWVAKAVERIGDHAKNIAEHVIYVVRGSDVRHAAIEEIERETAG